MWVLRGGFLHPTSERGGASLQDRVNKEKLVCVWEEYSKNQTMSNSFLCYFI